MSQKSQEDGPRYFYGWLKMAPIGAREDHYLGILDLQTGLATRPLAPFEIGQQIGWLCDLRQRDRAGASCGYLPVVVGSGRKLSSEIALEEVDDFDQLLLAVDDHDVSHGFSVAEGDILHLRSYPRKRDAGAIERLAAGSKGQRNQLKRWLKQQQESALQSESDFDDEAADADAQEGCDGEVHTVIRGWEHFPNLQEEISELCASLADKGHLLPVGLSRNEQEVDKGSLDKPLYVFERDFTSEISEVPESLRLRFSPLSLTHMAEVSRQVAESIAGYQKLVHAEDRDIDNSMPDGVQMELAGLVNHTTPRDW